jgi:hypothetical protein
MKGAVNPAPDDPLSYISFGYIAMNEIVPNSPQGVDPTDVFFKLLRLGLGH